MSFFPGEIPVAVNEGRVRIVVAEDRGLNFGCPDAAFERRPIRQRLGAGNLRAQRLRAAVNYPLFFRAGVLGIDIFAVEAGGHQNFVAGFSDPRGVVYLREGLFFGAAAGVFGLSVNVDDHKFAFWVCALRVSIRLRKISSERP